MSDEYAHLHASVQPFADEDDVSRIHRIRNDIWIDYARAQQLLGTFEDLLSFPKRTRMPNALLVGPTNNGKTMIIEKLRRLHPPVPAARTVRGDAHVPVLTVQMPPGPDESRFFGAIIAALGYPHAVPGQVVKRQDTAVRLMGETDVRLLVIDEAHNILSGSRLQQRRLLNLLRWLGNELRIPLLAVGTADAYHAIQSDDQLANRFEPMPLPPWEEGDEYRQLLSTFEALLPLRRASSLAKPSIAGKIHAASGGILGEVVAIVTRAAIRAVTAGSECITATLIDECGYRSPIERRRVVV